MGNNQSVINLSELKDDFVRNVFAFQTRRPMMIVGLTLETGDARSAFPSKSGKRLQLLLALPFLL